jgi:hypothetical protein
MNCNKIKELTTDSEVIIKALEGSEHVEVEKGNFVFDLFLAQFLFVGGLRRKGNKELPKLILKEKKSGHEEAKDPNVLTERDFKDPKIVFFKTETVSEEKPSWRDLEKDIVLLNPTIKILYSRMKDNLGQLAIASGKIDNEAIEKLVQSKITSVNYEYSFEIPNEEDLKQFWEEHGSHYEMVSKQKLRISKKRKRDEQKDDKSQKIRKVEEEDRQYTLAGKTYANINKVKSKAKAIMNVKEDGQKLENYEEEFMKEIIKNHPKHDIKMKDFSHFIVGEHPDFKNTR